MKKKLQKVTNLWKKKWQTSIKKWQVSEKKSQKVNKNLKNWQKVEKK